MNAKQLVHMSMDACGRNNPGSRIALYLDESMRRREDDLWLPVMNVEGQSYYAFFVPAVVDRVAEFFGSSLQDAQAKVGQINAERGLDHDDVIDMVSESISLASARRGER